MRNVVLVRLFGTFMCVASTGFAGDSQKQAATPEDSASPSQQITEIHTATSNGDTGKVSELLSQNPALLESRDDTGMTPLLLAARDGKLDVLTLLIGKGADIKATSTVGKYDALALAAKNGQKDVVSALLDRGADANSKISDGNTPITLAQHEGKTEVLALFKAHGYDVSPVLNWVTHFPSFINYDFTWILNSLKVSPDCRRVACGTHESNGTNWVYIDDKSQGPYDGLSQGFPIFSFDSARVAYVAWQGDQRFVVVDGKEQKPYDSINDFKFSPDSKRVAYWARSGKKLIAVVDGNEGKLLDELVRGSLIFSPDSKRVAYGGRAGNKCLFVIDGKEEKSYDKIGFLIFSPDGSRVAYAARALDHEFVVEDGKEEKSYDGIGAISFSPDGKRLAYVAMVGDKQLVVADGKEGKSFDGVGSIPIFSPDGKRLAYDAKSGDKWSLVIDGEEGKPCDGIRGATITFSPDSNRVAYTANSGDKWFVVADGTEEKPYDNIGKGFPLFSPDSKRLLYVAGVGNKHWVVVDGKEEKPYDFIGKGTPLFSPDSKRVAYVAGAGDQRLVVVDGKEDEPCDDIYTSPTFSPDSKQVVYAAREGAPVAVRTTPAKSTEINSGLGVTAEDLKPDDNVEEVPAFSSDGKRLIDQAKERAFESERRVDERKVSMSIDYKQVLVINGEKQSLRGVLVAGGKLIFDSPDSFHYLAFRGSCISLVEVALQPQK